MSKSIEVLSQIDALKLSIGETLVHPLYGVHKKTNPLFNKGKGTAPEMQKEIDRRIPERGMLAITDERNARSLVLATQPAISLDCSGFVFH